MADIKSDNEVPEQVSDDAVPADTEEYIPGNPFSNIRREITEEDLKSPAVQRILLAEVDKLSSKVVKLEETKDKYHTRDKQASVLEEKLINANSHNILYSFCISSGSAITTGDRPRFRDLKRTCVINLYWFLNVV